MSSTEDFKPEETNVVRLPRVSIDFKIPAWGLITAMALALLAVVNMWATLNSLSDKFTLLQATVNAAVAANTQIISDQQFIKFRLEKLESERQQRK